VPSRARERWQFGAVDHRWSGQLLMPVDHLAYTGRNVADAENVFVHTGGGATGLTAAVTAGVLLRDLLLKRETQLGDVFNPTRLPPRAWIDYAKHGQQQGCWAGLEGCKRGEMLLWTCAAFSAGTEALTFQLFAVVVVVNVDVRLCSQSLISLFTTSAG